MEARNAKVFIEGELLSDLTNAFVAVVDPADAATGRSSDPFRPLPPVRLFEIRNEETKSHGRFDSFDDAGAQAESVMRNRRETIREKIAELQKQLEEL